MAVTRAQLNIGKEISALRSRLSKRLLNIESRGLATDASNRAREILQESSVKGKTYRERQTIKRQLQQQLKSTLTTVRGSKSFKKIEVNLNNKSKEQIIKATISLPTKYRRGRVNELMQKAYEMYPAFRDRHWRYQVRDLINRGVQEHKKDKTILSRLEKIANDVQDGEFKEAQNKFNLKF